jgi:NAD(P)-dependent dehydrogenase (short-subunit alcohol dehydrogenase family)
MSIAVVTGGAGGIGIAVCRALAQAGHIVAIIDIDENRSTEAERALAREGITAFAFPTDLTDAQAVEAMGDEVNSRGEVAVLVNNAGHAYEANYETADNDDWHRSIALNLNSANYVTRVFLPGMKRRRAGVIVNVASVNGLGAFGNPAYSVAKAGLIHFTRQIAVEYGPYGIRAVSVVPGTVRTPAWAHRVEENPRVFDDIATFYPLRRVADPVDVANTVAFLASDAARAITGSEILVDCGLMAGNSRISDHITRADDR